MSTPPEPAPPVLDLSLDVVALTAALCDIPSVSLQEEALADAVEAALRALPHLSVTRLGNTVVARTDLGRAERVVLAGHLDTVPITADPDTGAPTNLPTRRIVEDGEEMLYGRGTVDMKGGVAVQLRIAHLLSEPNRDITFVFYEGEEIESEFNGLLHIEQQRRDLIDDADFAVLLEPTSAAVEGGCKGTLRARVTTTGTAAHSARPWKGHNAIHDAEEILRRLNSYRPATHTVDGLEFREALNAVLISGGIAGNVIPDRCVVTVNYRYSPSLDAAGAEAHVREVFDGFAVEITDNAPGARPGLHLPAAQAFVAALAVPVEAKQGWTDVSRFSAMGVPAVNFGPGDPNLAHMDDERAPTRDYVECEAALLRWLS
ncbi:MAG TPA: succinyl-diaminopimelate desuccinylase [Intrasporangiaceae bacterium]|nr:succinyl-diaminopimelate desuccinylase [Intrasporangiaceae bacterium]